MFDADPPFRPVRRRDGYLALEDMGLVGDGTTAALVGLDGSIPWLCLPRFDSEPLFCSLLDHARGGCFTVAPDEVVEAPVFERCGSWVARIHNPWTVDRWRSSDQYARLAERERECLHRGVEAGQRCGRR
jgi:hypothetical protein